VVPAATRCLSTAKINILKKTPGGSGCDEMFNGNFSGKIQKQIKKNKSIGGSGCDEMFNGEKNWGSADLPDKYTIDETFLSFSTGYLYMNSTHLKWNLLDSEKTVRENYPQGFSEGDQGELSAGDDDQGVLLAVKDDVPNTAGIDPHPQNLKEEVVDEFQVSKDSGSSEVGVDIGDVGVDSVTDAGEEEQTIVV
jgi:hypothetical protein